MLFIEKKLMLAPPLCVKGHSLSSSHSLYITANFLPYIIAEQRDDATSTPLCLLTAAASGNCMILSRESKMRIYKLFILANVSSVVGTLLSHHQSLDIFGFLCFSDLYSFLFHQNLMIRVAVCKSASFYS